MKSSEKTQKPSVTYAMFEYSNGFKKAMYWSREKMEAHALKYSRGYAGRKRLHLLGKRL